MDREWEQEQERRRLEHNRWNGIPEWKWPQSAENILTAAKGKLHTKVQFEALVEGIRDSKSRSKDDAVQALINQVWSHYQLRGDQNARTRDDLVWYCKQYMEDELDQKAYNGRPKIIRRKTDLTLHGGV